MRTEVAKAIFNSHSYPEYRKMVTDLLIDGKSSGNQQSEELTGYSSMNVTRMNRLDKTIKISIENISILQNLNSEYIWLIISEGWCGDAAQLLPIFNKMASHSNKKIEVKIVFRDENEELMNLFLTNKTKSIPKLIIIDKQTGNICNDFGPRPKGAASLINNFKRENGVIKDEARAELQLWYLHDKGQSTQNEVIEIMVAIDK